MLKKNSFVWSPEAEFAFEKLKEAMTTGPVLALPDFSKMFIVECNASGAGLGAVLMQDEHPIAFYSQSHHGKNLLLSTYEKEMLALVYAVLRWRPYLLGNRFLIRTDHKSLQFLLGQVITTPTQQKWLARLMGYDFSIEYKKGKENSVADGLSRQMDGISTAAISQPLQVWVNSIKEEIQNTLQLQALVQRIKEGEAVGPWEFKGDLLFFKDRIYLLGSSNLCRTIIQAFHELTHEGIHKTLHRIREPKFVL